MPFPNPLARDLRMDVSAPAGTVPGYGDLRFNRRGGAKGFATDTLKARLGAGIRRSGALAEETENEFLAGLRGVDPYADAERSARAQYDTFREDLGRDLEGLRGEQVGMGRVNTGFATEDEDRLVGDSLKRLERVLAENALRAGGMNLQRFGMLGNFASEQGNRFLDLVSGGLDRKTAEENAEKQRQAGLYGAIGGLGGMALGFL